MSFTKGLDNLIILSQDKNICKKWLHLHRLEWLFLKMLDDLPINFNNNMIVSIIPISVKLYILTTTPWFNGDIIENNLLHVFQPCPQWSTFVIKINYRKPYFLINTNSTHCYIHLFKNYIHVWSFLKKKPSLVQMFLHFVTSVCSFLKIRT